MAGTEVQITEKDISETLRAKVNEGINLQLQVSALERAVSERDARIAELENELGEEAGHAESGKEEVSVHKEG